MATSGLSKETRKELSDKYLIPANCTLIDAPLLNPEIKAAVSETVHKRDKEKSFKLASSSPEPQVEGNPEEKGTCTQESARDLLETIIACSSEPQPPLNTTSSN
ncbi:hypothetical protein SFRURICE_013757 [Spodoptera frugiperda]|nr:hypothetical protein SFRURICE_013757 [Spodoptera frugiperda]